jgi:hypothetical protein
LSPIRFIRAIRGYSFLSEIIYWIDSVGVVGLQKHSFRYRAVPHAIS